MTLNGAIKQLHDLRSAEDMPLYYKPAIAEVINVLLMDAREVKRGKWVSKDLDNFRKYEVVCSECSARYVGNYDAYDEPYDFNFCPNCGADMRGEAND